MSLKRRPKISHRGQNADLFFKPCSLRSRVVLGYERAPLARHSRLTLMPFSWWSQGQSGWVSGRMLHVIIFSVESHAQMQHRRLHPPTVTTCARVTISNMLFSVSLFFQHLLAWDQILPSCYVLKFFQLRVKSYHICVCFVGVQGGFIWSSPCINRIEGLGSQRVSEAKAVLVTTPSEAALAFFYIPCSFFMRSYLHLPVAITRRSKFARQCLEPVWNPCHNCWVVFG